MGAKVTTLNSRQVLKKGFSAEMIPAFVTYYSELGEKEIVALLNLNQQIGVNSDFAAKIISDGDVHSFSNQVLWLRVKTFVISKKGDNTFDLFIQEFKSYEFDINLLDEELIKAFVRLGVTVAKFI
jgi:hypothetical protein